MLPISNVKETYRHTLGRERLDLLTTNIRQGELPHAGLCGRNENQSTRVRQPTRKADHSICPSGGIFRLLVGPCDRPEGRRLARFDLAIQVVLHVGAEVERNRIFNQVYIQASALAVDCEVFPVRREEYGLHAVAVWIMKKREADIVGNGERFLSLLCLQRWETNKGKWNQNESADNLPVSNEDIQVSAPGESSQQLWFRTLSENLARRMIFFVPSLLCVGFRR